jgi:hypothetical protein
VRMFRKLTDRSHERKLKATPTGNDHEIEQ